MGKFKDADLTIKTIKLFPDLKKLKKMIEKKDKNQ